MNDSVRARPRVHFTAAEGWINDPYGIFWDGTQYQLFYQAIPGTREWRPQCRWGHATSPDLVHWTEQEPVLVPQPFEVGCWSGSVVAPERMLFYTRVSTPPWDHASIAYARLEDGTWHTTIDDVAVPGPPQGARAFRDPFVFGHGDHWVMIVGGGLDDGDGAAFAYRSSDLTTWTYDGVLATGSGETWTGRIWECPQLFPLEDRWVLIVSVWDDSGLHHASAAVGDFDGRHFVATSWQQLTHGRCAYATATFVDREGRRCVSSWLRETVDPVGSAWSGAHSVPAIVTLDGDRIVLRPHPNVAKYARHTPDGDVIEDADIVEVFGPDGYRAYRTA